MCHWLDVVFNAGRLRYRTATVARVAGLVDLSVYGKTTKEQVLTMLGQPSGFFESEKILTYRLGYEPRNHGYYPVERESRNTGWPTWTNASFSLVLVFDDAGVLQTHSLVKVNR